MSKKIFLPAGFLAITLFFFLTSCIDCIEGNGKMATRSAKFNEITSVTLNLSADVKLVADSSNMVKIEGESNLIEGVILEQTGTKLKITSEHCFSSSKPMTITIPMKNVSELQLNGSGNIISGVKLTAKDLELGINGSGDIDLDLDATNVFSKINGSGNIMLRGSAQTHKIQVNGSGDVKAEHFPTGNVSVSVNGSGDCRVMATNGLNVKVRGSGSVYYTGSPDISTDIKGSGSVKKLN